MSQLFILLGLAVQSAEFPAALRAMEEARRSLCGSIVWSARVEGNQSITNRKHTVPTREIAQVSRYALNGDWVYENRGDQDGWTAWSGADERGVTKFPQLYLHNSDGYWYHQETGVSANWWKPAADKPVDIRDDVRDVRALGTLPWSRNLQGDAGLERITEEVARQPPTWREEQQGDTFIVEASYPSGRTITWWIDSEKGWNPVRVAEEYEGRVVAEARSTLKRFGEGWFPEITEYEVAGRRLETIRVTMADLGGEQSPKNFTPVSIGFEAGVQITASSSADPLFWNGDEVTTARQWFDDLKAGRRRRGPVVQRFHDNARFDSPYMTDEQRAMLALTDKQDALRVAATRHQGLWEWYVRWFIRRYSLDAEQAQKCWQMHAECRNEAEAYTQKKQNDLAPILAELDKPPGDTSDERLKELVERLDVLMGPVAEIFEKRLKPRLEKIPTRAQRRAAETVASTQPKSGP